jgi:hypothetical protein
MLLRHPRLARRHRERLQHRAAAMPAPRRPDEDVVREGLSRSAKHGA